MEGGNISGAGKDFTLEDSAKKKLSFCISGFLGSTNYQPADSLRDFFTTRMEREREGRTFVVNLLSGRGEGGGSSQYTKCKKRKGEEKSRRHRSMKSDPLLDLSLLLLYTRIDDHRKPTKLGKIRKKEPFRQPLL